ncbi:unnamed protein product [Ceratitis capitata]|uniref:(Mediterranean fruit fly) hypothetical protein n=1 Tax=Ceratitis capitata TaxID=7213 RepID=A0A811VB88_CERCA|nr:unnamed protein product [Ceratitis capitata]
MVLGRDGFTYPYHNYLGPRNTIYKDDESVDEADLDAYIHDLEYELASSDQDIRHADREAINNFISDFKKDYSFAEFPVCWIIIRKRCKKHRKIRKSQKEQVTEKMTPQNPESRYLGPPTSTHRPGQQS